MLIVDWTIPRFMDFAALFFLKILLEKLKIVKSAKVILSEIRGVPLNK